MRARAAAVVGGVAATLAAGPAAGRPPTPPPLAFQKAMLNRETRTVDVRIQSVTEVGIVVRLWRHGQRIGREEAMVHTGRTDVPVRIGPRTFHRLRPGLKVVVLIYFGERYPVRTTAALERAPSSMEASALAAAAR
jgi:hypothetical protein